MQAFFNRKLESGLSVASEHGISAGFACRSLRELQTQKGDRVRFSISEAFLPTQEELVALASPNEKVEGTVINFSDSGSKAGYFAVVDVIRRWAVVVPVEKLEVVQQNHKALMD